MTLTKDKKRKWFGRKQAAACFSVLLFAVQLLGCGGEPILVEEAESKETVYSVQQSAKQLASLFGAAEEAYLPEAGEETFFFEVRSRLQWLMDYHEWMFDQSADELADWTQKMEYTRFPEGREAVRFEVFGSQMNVFLLFSGPVWQEGSVCVGVGIPLADLFREEEWVEVVRISDPAAGEENGLFWNDGSYQYRDKGRVVTVVTDDAGTLFLEEQIVYCAVDGLNQYEAVGYVEADYHQSRTVSEEELAASRFSAVRRWSSWLGMTKQQLAAVMDDSFLWYESEDGVSGLASSQERRVELHMEAGICTAVTVPTQELFPHLSRSLSPEELMDHWPVPVTWSTWDDYRYEYFFKGFSMSMASSQSGAVPLWETYPAVYGSRGPQAGYVVFELDKRIGETVEK